MIDLETISGLPVEVTSDYHLKLKSPLAQFDPATRTLKELSVVLMDPNAACARNEMYYMYRDVHLPEDQDLIRKYNLRYDITVIPPAMIGQEFSKTAGHYHPYKPGTKFAYPEMYEVLHGEVLFLIQKMDDKYDQLVTVAYYVGKTGDKIVYPPNYGHIMINIGHDVLVTANWVADHFESLYQPVADKKGMAYYAVSDQQEKFKLVPNPNYTNHPQAREILPKNLRNLKVMNIAGPSYTAGVYNPKNLEFLTDPEKYAVELSSITS